jgi:hypothetical protein
LRRAILRLRVNRPKTDFIDGEAGPNVIKLFTSVIYECSQ